MSEATVVGVQPWLPSPLSRSPWWTEPVRAERLAALRMGVGLVLLLDILGTYLPRMNDFFGPASLTPPDSFAGQVPSWQWHRVWFDQVPSVAGWYGILGVWATAAMLLTLGLFPQLAAGLAWFISISLTALNPALHNSGDQVRNILLFYLMLTPCGATGRLRLRRSTIRSTPIMVHPWALRLLLIQMALIYFMNGLFKLRGSHWHTGQALGLVLGDCAWTRWSFAGWPLPGWLLQAMTWLVLLWELAFPFCLFLPRVRRPALWLGVAFHVGTGLTMRLGPFPLYMLCLYMPLVPWENRNMGEHNPSESVPKAGEALP